MAPGEKLGGCEKPLSAPCRGNNKEVAQFSSGFDRLDAKHVVQVADAKDETPLIIKIVCRQVGEFVDPGKAAAVKFGPPGEKGVDPVKSNKKAESKPLTCS